MTKLVMPALSALLLSAVTFGCNHSVSEKECLELLDHYTEEQINQAHPSANRAERMEMQLEARKKAQLDPAFAECSSSMSRAQLQCAMEAHSADQIERCLM